MLDVHAVVKAMAQGSAYLEWRDEDGLAIGFASIQGITGTDVRIFYRLHGTRNVEKGIGQIDIELRYGKGGTYWSKPGFVCPWCRHSRNWLYWVDGA